ncbi:MAG TPA: hypothetical protein VLC98_06380 [Phnomibacter sp.]|nr:hypothetical protein [Phnomibacter sp.]
MIYFFGTGFLCGGSLALILLAGKLYSYRKQLMLMKRSMEQMEKHHSNMQLQLQKLLLSNRKDRKLQDSKRSLSNVA